jgi:hypothetical protein
VSGLGGLEKIKNESAEEPLTASVLYFTFVRDMGYRLAGISPSKLIAYFYCMEYFPHDDKKL